MTQCFKFNANVMGHQEISHNMSTQHQNCSLIRYEWQTSLMLVEVNGKSSHMSIAFG